jgi:hypothetical protein
MGRPVLLAESFFNTRLFPNHTVGASSEASGRDVGQIGSGRRMKALNCWTPSTTNSAEWAKVACDRVRAADMWVLDRGHNLEGKSVRLQVSNDNFASYTEIASGVLPTSVLPYSRLDQWPGVKTEEGAWLYRHSSYSGRYWRIYVDAMGAGLAPEIVNLQVGLSFRPEFPEVKPYSHGQRELLYEQTVSPSAWVGAGQIAQRRRKRLHLRLADAAEYALARYHIEELVLRGRGTWYVPDDEQAEKAFFVRAEPQTAGFEISGDWSEMQGSFEMVEQEPKLV